MPRVSMLSSSFAKWWSTGFSTHRQAWNQATVNDAHALLDTLSQFQFVIAVNTVCDAIVCVILQ